MDEEIKRDLEGEIYFLDLNQEQEYFEGRLEAFKGYHNDFLENASKGDLAKRYIKALALLSFCDPMEVRAFRDLYVDCLIRLGVNDYCIDKEIENYKRTHNLNPEKTRGMFVSGRKL